VTPLRALIIIIFLLEKDMWVLGCYMGAIDSPIKILRTETLFEYFLETQV